MSAKSKMKKSNKTEHSSSSSSSSKLAKSIESFFIKILKTKSKNGGSISKKAKTLKAKQSPDKLLIENFLSESTKKHTNCKSDKSNQNKTKNSDYEETSILKYLIKALDETSFNLDQTSNSTNETEESDKQLDDECDTSYASAIIHDTSTNSASSSSLDDSNLNNQTFLIHDEESESKQEEEKDSTRKIDITNLEQTKILKALLKSYPNFIQDLKRIEHQDKTEQVLIRKENSNNQDEKVGELESSVIIHEEENNEQIIDKEECSSLNGTFLIHECVEEPKLSEEQTNTRQIIENYYNLGSEDQIQWQNYSLDELKQFDSALAQTHLQNYEQLLKNYTNYSNFLLVQLNDISSINNNI